VSNRVFTTYVDNIVRSSNPWICTLLAAASSDGRRRDLGAFEDWDDLDGDKTDFRLLRFMRRLLPHSQLFETARRRGGDLRSENRRA
jgi:hypothetical protein